MNKGLKRVWLVILTSIATNAVYSENLFNTILTGATLTITPTYNPQAPDKMYHPGIHIVSPGFSVSHCNLQSNAFCTFAASNNQPANLEISGPSGELIVNLCLNPNKPTASCEMHHMVVPPVIFITQSSYSGDLNGITGADALCNNQAYISGSILPPGRQFKALLLSTERYPCSNPSNNDSGQCNHLFANDWPLISNMTYYKPDGVTIAGRTNRYGVFDENIIALQDMAGHESIAQFWSGIQSVHSSADGFHIDAWAFDDMHPNRDQQAYANNLAYCQNWHSASATAHGSVGSTDRIDGTLSGPVPLNEWGNYYQFYDDDLSYLFNLFTISAYYTCDGLAKLVCVG